MQKWFMARGFPPYSLPQVAGFPFNLKKDHTLRIGGEGGESEDMMLASDIEPEPNISAPAAPAVCKVSVAWP